MFKTLLLAATLAIAAVGPSEASLKEGLMQRFKRQACPTGQVYDPVGYPCRSKCSDLVKPTECRPVAGCYCPAGQYFNTQNQCVPKDKCPTQPPPPAGCHCGGCGDPHYTTCDGKHYDYQGLCSYYFTQGSGYSVQAENGACGGSVACIQSVTVTLGTFTAKMTNLYELYVNGLLIPAGSMPYTSTSPAITIVKNGGYQFVATLPNGIIVTYYGSCVDVFIPPALNGSTNGLCGTYNGNQADDFLTASGTQTASATVFGDSWIANPGCTNTFPPPGRKKRAATNVALAQALCNKLVETPLSSCNAAVSPKPFLSDCAYDVTSTNGDATVFACMTLASYAAACAFSTGKSIPWREVTPECALKCPTGTTYNSCGKPCSTTCKDLSLPKPCTTECVEGCFCPTGFYQDKNGRCVAEVTCPCYIGDKEFPPGKQEVIPGQKLPCTCKNGRWMCSGGVIVGK